MCEQKQLGFHACTRAVSDVRYICMGWQKLFLRICARVRRWLWRMQLRVRDVAVSKGGDACRRSAKRSSWAKSVRRDALRTTHAACGARRLKHTCAHSSALEDVHRSCSENRRRSHCCRSSHRHWYCAEGARTHAVHVDLFGCPWALWSLGYGHSPTPMVTRKQHCENAVFPGNRRGFNHSTRVGVFRPGDVDVLVLV